MGCAAYAVRIPAEKNRSGGPFDKALGMIIA
jgi:hypothetical protein